MSEQHQLLQEAERILAQDNTRSALHDRRQQHQEAFARLQLLAKLLSPTRQLTEADREDVSHFLEELLDQLHD